MQLGYKKILRVKEAVMERISYCVSRAGKGRTGRWLGILMCSVLAVGASAPVVTHAQTLVEEIASTTLNYTGTASITYVGKWHTTEVMRNWSGGTAAASTWGHSTSAPVPECRSDASVPASKVTLSFNGTRVRWIGARGPQLGKANVRVDGELVPESPVDTYASTEQMQTVLFTSETLEPGTHTLEIEVLGDKNSANTTTSCIIVVDAFDIEGNPSGRIQEIGPAAVTYYGTWIQGDANRPYSGGTVSYSYAELDPGIVPVLTTPEGTLDPRVTTRAVFIFSGTRVSWIGFVGPQMGKANVYVDGELVPEPVDAYAPAEQTQVPLFTSAALPAGTHTLAIEVRGDKNPSSSGVFIAVDAFEVTP